MMRKTTKTLGNQVMVEGMMTFGKIPETGQRTLDFMCCEEMEAEPFEGDFHVQCMRDGNVYLQQKTQRPRAKSTLLRKAAHGRLSATRDDAYQLTLKIFKREGIDVVATLTREAVELLQSIKF